MTNAEKTPESNDPVLPERETYTPDDLALILFGREGMFKGAKAIRGHLRATYPRPVEMKNKSWIIGPNMAQATFAHFLGQRSEVTVQEIEPSESDAKA